MDSPVSQLAGDARRIGGILTAYVSVGMAIMAFRYVTGDPRLYHSLFRDKYISELGIVWLHGVPATLSLLLGPVVFWLAPRLVRGHRTLGMLYMVCVLLASGTGFLMGLVAYGGSSSQIGFCLMSALWAGTAIVAWRHARARRLAVHREWMLRNFALTFGAVLLRVYLYGLTSAGFEYSKVYPIVTWLAWVPSLILVELYLRRPVAVARLQEG